MTDFIAWMNGLPSPLVYLVLTMGAAIENIVPAVPADTFVALGGFLAGAGDLNVWWVAIGTITANVLGAIGVFYVSRRHGAGFFRRGFGKRLMSPHQMERMGTFYERWGVLAMFGSRFLPGLRAIVPVFAGATHQPWTRVVPPLALASAIWYGGLVALGLLAGQNLGILSERLGSISGALGTAAMLVGGVFVAWWVRSRHRARERDGTRDADSAGEQ
jgi:membrane protein DedA with SNARE-associated domain